jgi:hypothetical protein
MTVMPPPVNLAPGRVPDVRFAAFAAFAATVISAFARAVASALMFDWSVVSAEARVDASEDRAPTVAYRALSAA